jgi:hypothetical protein
MFDYFGVLISVILGMGLTHLLKGLAKLIHSGREIRLYWVHVVWTANVLIFVLAIWWGMYWWRGLQNWTFEWFFFISLYSTALYMWASLLYPPEFGQGLDFEEHFFEKKSWFFGIQTMMILMDIPETVEKSVLNLRPIPEQYFALIPVLLLISIVGLATNNRRVHAGLSVAWLISTLSYIFLAPTAKIVEH